MRSQFIGWLKRKYRRTDSLLQEAWNDSTITFEKVTIPTPDERAVQDGSLFRNPKSEIRNQDYYRCQHELVADNILRFCQRIKETWPRPILTGAFYGYFFSMFNRQAAGGHLELQRVLASPWIDYLSGPQVYYPDDGYDPGEPYRSRSLVRSITLHGKLWLDEYDQQPRRTFPVLNGKDNSENYRRNIQENIAAIERNVLSPLTKGAGLWFYDFGPSGMNLHRGNEHDIQSGTIGYWDHPDYLRSIKRLKTLADSLLHHPWQTGADVLLVYDTEIFYHLKSTKQDSCPISSQVVDWLPLALSYAGVAWDAVHLDDLSLLDPTPYRAVIFANTWLLEEKDLVAIEERWAKDGRHMFWMYAPGQLGSSNPSQVTGFQLVAAQCDTVPAVRAVGSLPRQTAWGKLSPLWSVSDPSATTIASYEHDGSTVFAKKKIVGHTAWFLGIPPIDANWWRCLLAESGVHFYTEDGVVYAGGGLLVFHTKTGGDQKIRLKNGKEVLVEMPVGAGTVVVK
jgi:Beta-galactosidase